jgi:hypothetical protein
MSAVLQEELVSIERAIPMRRVWAMPSSFTFDIPPIRALVKSYLYKSRVSVDPFARNKRWATYTNDLNPETAAESHVEALEFLADLKRRGVKADLVLFDPPYSARQVMECYNAVGRNVTMQDTQGASWANWKSAIAEICTPDAFVLSFGWNTNAMGIQHGFDIVEILLVAHGGVHNETICTVERKRESAQFSLIGDGDVHS